MVDRSKQKEMPFQSTDSWMKFVVTNIHISDLWKVNELSRLTEERKERN